MKNMIKGKFKTQIDHDRAKLMYEMKFDGFKVKDIAEDFGTTPEHARWQINKYIEATQAPQKREPFWYIKAKKQK